MPKNWTPVALSKDVPPLVVMPVVVEGQDLALWRSASGRLAAWSDRCPHRGMRLSHGFVRGEALSCIYHGWRYGAGGNCLRIPAHPDLEPPETIRVQGYAAVEAGGMIWVAGDAADLPPPELPVLEPLRSLTVETGAGALARLSGLVGQDVLRGRLAGVAVAIALQPLGAGRCVLHVMTEAAAPEDRVAVSREIEALRRRAEEVAA